jgi:histidyl-tRNA synthetase
MRDFLPDDVRRRSYVIGVIEKVYRRYGFEPLETPAVENVETLLGKYGEEGNKLIFKILKRGEHEQTGQADLALRYDLTVPLARVVAEHRSRLPRFFKRYQIQPVWRADRPARGRFREFFQCDVDAIGSRSMAIEAELCAAVSDTLEHLGFGDFRLRLNHREVLRGLLDTAGVPAPLHDASLVAVDKLDKLGAEGVAGDLRNRGVTAEAAAAVIAAFQLPPGVTASEALALLQERIGGSDAARAGLAELTEILSLSASSPAAERLHVDPGLARGLSYYTGAIFEVAVPDLAGSLGGGGRYDNLIGMFLGEEVPACGFSLGLERILVVMGERGMFPAAVTGAPADVLVTSWDEDALADSLALARELRAAGLCVDVYPEGDRVGKQVRYASARGIPFVTIIGEDERASGEVTVKRLSTGEQHRVARGVLSDTIRELRGRSSTA